MGNDFSWGSRTEKYCECAKQLRTFYRSFKHLVNPHVTKYYVIDSITFGTCGCLTNRCREIYFEEEKKVVNWH